MVLLFLFCQLNVFFSAVPLLFYSLLGEQCDERILQYDDSKSQEMIEHKIKNAPPGQGTMRMLTREEWEEFQEVRPRTPFESKLARPNAKIRTGEPLHMVRLSILLVLNFHC